jgi:hypothetical protein
LRRIRLSRLSSARFVTSDLFPTTGEREWADRRNACSPLNTQSVKTATTTHSDPRYVDGWDRSIEGLEEGREAKNSGKCADHFLEACSLPNRLLIRRTFSGYWAQPMTELDLAIETLEPK